MRLCKGSEVAAWMWLDKIAGRGGLILVLGYSLLISPQKNEFYVVVILSYTFNWSF